MDDIIPNLPTEEEARKLTFPSLAKKLQQFISATQLQVTVELNHFIQLVTILESMLSDRQDSNDQDEESSRQFEFNSNSLGAEGSKLKRRQLRFMTLQDEKRDFWLKRLRRQMSIGSIVEEFNTIETNIKRDVKIWQNGNPGDYQFRNWTSAYFAATRAFFHEWKERLINSLSNLGRQDYQHNSESEKTRLRIVEGLRRSYVDRMAGSIKMTQLPWVLLPPGELGRSILHGSLQSLQRRNPKLKIQEDRMDYAIKLNPREVFVGHDEFDGYFAFTFESTHKSLLENPVEGNAAYVFNENWRSLSRLTKTHLLDQYKGSIQRVIHRHDGSWREQLKRCLNL